MRCSLLSMLWSVLFFASNTLAGTQAQAVSEWQLEPCYCLDRKRVALFVKEDGTIFTQGVVFNISLEGPGRIYVPQGERVVLAPLKATQASVLVGGFGYAISKEGNLERIGPSNLWILQPSKEQKESSELSHFQGRNGRLVEQSRNAPVGFWGPGVLQIPEETGVELTFWDSKVDLTINDSRLVQLSERCGLVLPDKTSLMYRHHPRFGSSCVEIVVPPNILGSLNTKFNIVTDGLGNLVVGVDRGEVIQWQITDKTQLDHAPTGT